MELRPADCLAATSFVDSDHPTVTAFAARATNGIESPREQAAALFLAVRDGYRYDPYGATYETENFLASTVVGTDRNWCVPKSILLTAACRASGIPAALGFADVRNHLQSEKLSGTKVLEWDGTGDALMHPFDTTGNRHMEYVRDRGTYVDLPLDELLATFAELYPHMGTATSGGGDPMFA